MTTRIKATGQFNRQKITRWTTREIARPDATLGVRTFLRYTEDGGLVAVTSYIPNDPAELAETLVEMCHNGYNCWRWYQHAVVTGRGAARLVSRFLADWREYLEERGLQP